MQHHFLERPFKKTEPIVGGGEGMDIVAESLVLLWRKLLQRPEADVDQRQPEFPR